MQMQLHLDANLDAINSARRRARTLAFTRHALRFYATVALPLFAGLVGFIAAATVLASCTPSSTKRVLPKNLGEAPPSVVGIKADGAPVCGPDLAANAFGFGLCTCDSISFSTVLRVDALDPTATAVAAVGTNGDFTSTGDSDIDGDLVVAGNALPIGAHDVAGALRAGGDVTAAGDIDVGGDAFVGGDIGGFIIDVGGTLHAPADSHVGIGVSSSSAVNEPVAVAPPCPCDVAAELDVPGFIADARDHNDNDAIGLHTDSLVGLLAPKDITLPPGHYYVDAVQAIAPLDIHVSGPTSLYVDGDFDSVSIVDIHTDNGGTLDIFIGGSLHATGDFDFAEDGPPSSVRTYIAGSDDILLAGDLDFAGDLWAPNARLVAAGPLDVAGAVLVKEVVEAGVIHVGYDTRVGDGAGDDCGLGSDDVDPNGGNDGDTTNDPGPFG